MFCSGYLVSRKVSHHHEVVKIFEFSAWDLESKKRASDVKTLQSLWASRNDLLWWPLNIEVAARTKKTLFYLMLDFAYIWTQRWKQTCILNSEKVSELFSGQFDLIVSTFCLHTLRGSPQADTQEKRSHTERDRGITVWKLDLEISQWWQVCTHNKTQCIWMYFKNAVIHWITANWWIIRGCYTVC